MKNVKRIYEKHYRMIHTIGLLTVIIVFSCLCAWQKTYTTEYVYTNGHLQNYNAPRRLLDGQIPYVDFANYLGAGHLYSMSLMLLLIGNNFTSSIFASGFLTVLYAILSISAIAWLVLKNRNKALLTGLAAVILRYSNSKITAILFPDKDNALSYMLGVGNSARTIRLASIFFFVFAIAFAILLLRFLAARFAFIKRKHQSILEEVIGGLSGLFVLWSNDSGPSIYLAFSFTYLIFTLFQYQFKWRSVVKAVLRYIVCSLAALLVGILIITQGHIGIWFKSMLGIASYQFWYYDYPVKNPSLLNLDLGYTSMVVLALAITFFVAAIRSRKNKEACFRFGMLMYICMASFFAANIYHLGSGLYLNEHEELLIYALLISGIVYFCGTLFSSVKSEAMPKVATTAISLLCIVQILALSVTQISLRSINDERPGSYIYDERLAGYITTQEYENLDRIEAVIGEDRVFSTWAGTLEYRQNQYQPSGYDYIIHAMGDDARDQYLDTFNQGDFTYVSTMRDTHRHEPWARNANWFFYREVYSNYEPVYMSDQQIFWRESDGNNAKDYPVNITVNQVAEGVVVIEVFAQDDTVNGTLDLSLAYQTTPIRNWTDLFVIHRTVNISSETAQRVSSYPANTSYNLPANIQTFVPVQVINGYGIITLQCSPLNMQLTVEEAQAVQFFDDIYKYVGAVSITENCIYFHNTVENMVRLEGANSLLSTSGESVEIKSIAENGDLIEVGVSDIEDEGMFSLPYALEIIK